MLSLSYGVMNQQQKKTKRLGEYWHSSVKDLRLWAAQIRKLKLEKLNSSLYKIELV